MKLTNLPKSPVRMLVMGLPGAGKTSALASLVPHFKMRFADFDNGIGVLTSMLPADVLEKSDVIVRRYTDRMRMHESMLIPDGKPRAFGNFLNEVNNQFDEKEPWDERTIFVLDTATLMCDAVKHHVLDMRNGYTQQHKNQPLGMLMLQDYGAIGEYLSSVLKFIANPNHKFHIIVNAHITFKHEGPNENAGLLLGLPKFVGSKTSENAGAYFTSILLASADAGSSRTVHSLLTRAPGLVRTKMPYQDVAATLPSETGLATIFEAAGFITRS